MVGFERRCAAMADLPSAPLQEERTDRTSFPPAPPLAFGGDGEPVNGSKHKQTTKKKEGGGGATAAAPKTTKLFIDTIVWRKKRSRKGGETEWETRTATRRERGRDPPPRVSCCVLGVASPLREDLLALLLSLGSSSSMHTNSNQRVQTNQRSTTKGKGKENRPYTHTHTHSSMHLRKNRKEKNRINRCAGATSAVLRGKRKKE